MFGTLTNNAGTTNLTLGDQLIADNYRQICAERDWYFLEGQFSFATVANQQTYSLPYDYDQLITATVQVGSYSYPIKEAASRQDWDRINDSTNYASNYPVWYYIYQGSISFWPTLSTASDTITLNYRKLVSDISIADYSTGNIDTITNLSKNVVGSGTSWNASMIGRWLQVAATATAATCGDNFWYQIATVPTATTLTLSKNYGDRTLGPGATATYSIVQPSLLPEAYQDLPVYKAVQVYFTSIQPELGRADRYKVLYDEMREQMLADEARKTTSVVIEKVGDIEARNPNLFVTL